MRVWGGGDEGVGRRGRGCGEEGMRVWGGGDEGVGRRGMRDGEGERGGWGEAEVNGPMVHSTQFLPAVVLWGVVWAGQYG